MGTRRRHLFVLLFVLGAGRGLGARHRRQGNEARPRPPGRPRARLPGPADRHLDRSQRRRHRRLDLDHRTADQQARRLRARSRAARHRQITVSLPGITDANRAAEQVGSTAQLYFYDWEPNLIGPETRSAATRAANPPEGPLKASEKRWQEAGRNPTAREQAADLRRRLPDRLRSGAARRRTEAGRKLHRTARSPSPATTCSRKPSRTN